MLIHLLWFLLIGLIAGWTASVLMKRRGIGLFGLLIVGVIGALLGGWVFGLLGLAAYTIVGSLISAIVGSVLLLYLIRFIRR